MIVHLSGYNFMSTGHKKFGAPVYDETCGDIPDGSLPCAKKPAWPLMSARDYDGCFSIDSITLRINGLDMKLWSCASTLNQAFMYAQTHHEIYIMAGNTMAKALGEKCDLDLHEKGRSISLFKERVISYGYNNTIVNAMPAHRFIELLCDGRFSNEGQYKEYCGVLLVSIGRAPTDNPVSRAREVFKTTEAMTELLRVLAFDKQRTWRQQEEQYIQWNRQTKSTFTTC